MMVLKNTLSSILALCVGATLVGATVLSALS